MMSFFLVGRRSIDRREEVINGFCGLALIVVLATQYLCSIIIMSILYS